MVDASLGERELNVMAVLWELGSGTVAEVNAKLDDELGTSLAYTTVLTILRNLEAKRFVRREAEGRGHRYFPRVKQQTAQRRALTRIVDTMFGGSPHALIAQLVDQHDLSSDELRDLMRQLDHAQNDAQHDRAGDDPVDPSKRERDR